MARAAETASVGEHSLDWSAAFHALQVGQRFHSEPRRVSEADVIVFCALSGDWHPQHWDAGWAAHSVFGERIAHGMLVLSLAVGLVPFDPARVRALRRVGETVFKRPVRFGEQITLSAEVAALKPVDEQAGLVDVRLSVKNGEGALAARGSVQVLWSNDGVPRSQERSSYWSDAVPDAAEDRFVAVPL